MNSVLSKKYQSPNKSSKKKLEVNADLRSSIKELLMEFHNYTKLELHTVLELCDYILEAAQFYLRATPKTKVKSTLSAFLAGDVEPGISSLGMSPSKFGIKDSDKIEEASKEVEVFVPTGPNYFETILTNDLVYYIFDFLDSKSLGQAGFTCKKFHKVSVHPYHFKKFCRKLYPQFPPLPLDSPFNNLLQRINQAPRGEFLPSVIAQANKDIRSLAWQPNLKAYYTPTVFYKQFKDMRDVFLNCPRVRYGGVYMMKEKYIRAGAKDTTGFYDPYHVIEFFRYIRFFPDGLVMSTLSVNRLRADKLIKLFNPDNQMTDEEMENYNQNSVVRSVLHGEYMVQKSTVHVRLNAKTTFYEFELEINSTEPGLFDQIKMVTQNMRLVGEEHVEPLQNHHQGTKLFKFVKVDGLLHRSDKEEKEEPLEVIQ